MEGVFYWEKARREKRMLLGTGVAEKKRRWEGEPTDRWRQRERGRWEVGRTLFKRKHYECAQGVLLVVSVEDIDPNA